MRRNGFTLIELLAVIVILAIIAVIAVPIVLNIIDESKENATLRSAEFYLDAVELAVADRVMHHGAIPNKAYEVMRDGNICLETLNSSGICVGTGGRENNKDDILTIEVKGEKPTSGQIMIENGQIVNELSTDKTVKIQLVISGQTIIKNENNEFEITSSATTPVEKICTIEKQDETKYSKGDVVTCKLNESTDKFYVIEDAELSVSTIRMLTEKNIHTTEYRQSDSAGTVAFSTSQYWSSSINSYPADIYDSNSLLYPIVEEYVSYLNTKLTGATGSLLTYSQAENLDCSDSNYTCSAAQNWVYSTSYWTSFVASNNALWVILTNATFAPGNSYDMFSGVRPVITISTSDIK